MRYIFFLLALITFSSCDQMSEFFSRDNMDSKGRPLARVDDKYLYDKDLSGLINQKTTKEDSANIINRYVNNWINRQLMMSEAEKQMDIDEGTIERRIQEYRFQLIVHEFEKQYINQYLDTAISTQEIAEFYKEHTDDFILKTNIVRGKFLKFPSETPKIKKIKKLLLSSKEEDLEELKTTSYAYADFVHLNDSLWLELDELLFATPFMNSTADKIKGLKYNKLWEATDSTHTYMYKFEDYKFIDQTSPLPFVKKYIREIILNKRKVQLRKELQRTLFENATLNKSYEIYEM